jgi:hypothetical protein
MTPEETTFGRTGSSNGAPSWGFRRAGHAPNWIYYKNNATRSHEWLFGCAQVDFYTMQLIMRYSTLYGHAKDWPTECRALVWKASRRNWLKKRAEREPF